MADEGLIGRGGLIGWQSSNDLLFSSARIILTVEIKSSALGLTEPDGMARWTELASPPRVTASDRSRSCAIGNLPLEDQHGSRKLRVEVLVHLMLKIEIAPELTVTVMSSKKSLLKSAGSVV